MTNEDKRSTAARVAAEKALVNVVYHYGSCPEFVVLGGLIPAILCSKSKNRHAGTTDVDVQVDLEIAKDAVNTKNLENALKKSGFQPSDTGIWRWVTENQRPKVEVKFELLADLGTQPNQAIIKFDDCEQLGAVNLRGTGYASIDKRQTNLKGEVAGQIQEVTINITGIGGFILAKAAAAYSRRKTKDWYDIAFVILNNDDDSEPLQLATSIKEKFKGKLTSEILTAIRDLKSNFENENCQGSIAFGEQYLFDHPHEDAATAKADSIVAVTSLCDGLLVQD